MKSVETTNKQAFLIFVFDPTARVIYRWEEGLVETQVLELPNGSLIPGTAIWQELQAAKTRLKMTTKLPIQISDGGRT